MIFENLLSSDWFQFIKYILKIIFKKKSKGYILEKPFIDNESLIFFNKEVDKCKTYLEYGSGGSTIYVSKKKKTVLSVENNLNFYEEVRRQLNAQGLKANIYYANTGLTGSYGIPIFKKTTQKRLIKWKNYVTKPWINIPASFPYPDLIFIDGRFRVACSLYSIIRLRNKKNFIILVDDYLDRKEYKIIERYSNFIGIKGRMGIFTAPKKFNEAIYEELESSISKWL